LPPRSPLLRAHVPNVQIVQVVQVVQRNPYGSDGLNDLNGFNCLNGLRSAFNVPFVVKSLLLSAAALVVGSVALVSSAKKP
jgi:hypothetical protein